MADVVKVDLPVKQSEGVATSPVALGTWVQVKTSPDGLMIEGSIFTLDPMSGFLVLEGVDKTHMIQIESIESVTVDESSRERPTAARSAVISEEELRKLEIKTREQAEKAIASIGKNVSPIGQAIFDALSKTMPCEWEEQNIRVMQVVVSPPYDSSSCTGTNQAMLDRMKKVLDGVHRNLRLKQ
ncbi:protein with role in RNA processing [Aphanomyces cochlioides]|nr:protein with role in RNA processing [Aphanomyces cochlioides]